MNRAAFTWSMIACFLAGVTLSDYARRDAFPDRACETDEECERACGAADDGPELVKVRT